MRRSLAAICAAAFLSNSACAQDADSQLGIKESIKCLAIAMTGNAPLPWRDQEGKTPTINQAELRAMYWLGRIGPGVDQAFLKKSVMASLETMLVPAAAREAEQKCNAEVAARTHALTEISK